jgi:hypothetical protein
MIKYSGEDTFYYNFILNNLIFVQPTHCHESTKHLEFDIVNFATQKKNDQMKPKWEPLTNFSQHTHVLKKPTLIIIVVTFSTFILINLVD